MLAPRAAHSTDNPPRAATGIASNACATLNTLMACALLACAVLACSPSTSRPRQTLPEELPATEVAPIYVVNTGEPSPGVPLALDRPLIVHGPGELVPAESERIDGLNAGFVTPQDGGFALRLTLGACHFEEPETLAIPVAEDCRHFNHRWLPERQQRVFVVPAGDYVISLINTTEAVAGLWIRDNEQLAITPLSAGGAVPGATTTYRATLTPGTYRYSCSLTPTPDYLLIVEAPERGE